MYTVYVWFWPTLLLCHALVLGGAVTHIIVSAVCISVSPTLTIKAHF